MRYLLCVAVATMTLVGCEKKAEYAKDTPPLISTSEGTVAGSPGAAAGTAPAATPEGDK